MRSSSRILTAVAALLLIGAATALAHDMFLKLESYYLEPNAAATVSLLNGTFERSENAIARERLEDVSVVGPDGTVHPPTSAWHDVELYADTVETADSVDTAILTFETGAPGTYIIGVSTRPTVFTLSGEDFNAYLEHDGVLDVLDDREEAGTLDDEATERYSKHVKALVQVGDARSDDFSTALDYPIEFIPLQNPYELGVGDALDVRLLRDGEPVADQLVYAGYEGQHAHADTGEHVHTTPVSTRTNAEGVARIPLSAAGKWFIRTIHMVETTSEPDVDYESNWATLTFEIR